MTRRKRLLWVLFLVATLAGAWVALKAYQEHSAGARVDLYHVAKKDADEVLLDLRSQPPAPRLVHRFTPGAHPRNVILILGDGMGFHQISAARMALKGVNGRLFIERFPITGWSWTHSIDELYTDSAAGASALATGYKTKPLMLSQTPEGEPQKTFLEVGIERGMRAALLTTSIIFDATPSAFVVHHSHRRDYPEVTRQMANSGVELLLSEGVDAESERWKEIWPEILETYRNGGYRIVESWEELRTLAPSSEEKIAAFLPPDSLALERTTHPLLSDLSRLALERLSDAEHGFFLLVEDEDTDTHSHQGNMNRVVTAIDALDEVAQQAVEFADANGETLVLVTADHETGALAIIDGKDGGKLNYRWISGNHSTSPVPVFAYGPGAERFSGVLDNTEIPRILDELLELGLFEE